MIDMRNYAEIIRSTIKECSKADKHYNWKVKAINKGEAEFQWSYLSDKDEPFSLRVDSLGDFQCVVVSIPYCDSSTYISIGDSRWDDAKTLEEGVPMAIRSAVNRAHHVF